ncbi:MAG: AMP-binding protein [Chloroflexi bacterium]|nr:AMP-binding protein [Chloroflexota bacterium]
MLPRKHSAARVNRLTKFVAHAYRNAPAVRALLDTAGIKPSQIKSPSDLEKIPVTPKDHLIELQLQAPPFGGFLAVPLHQVHQIFQSPGPLYEPWANETNLARVAGKIFKIAGFKRGDIVINTLSYHLVPAGMILQAGLQKVGATIVPTGVGNSELQVKLVRELGVTGYAGTPSFLMLLLQKAEELGVDVRAQWALKRALFTAEPYPPSLRQQFEGHYGFKTTNVYATAELGFLAHDCEAQQGLHFADDVIIQICDPVTGLHVAPNEAGQVVVTTFNETYPLIRFGTGDMAVYLDAPCACGRKTHRLALVGRIGDAVKVRGMFVHPNQLRQAIAKFPAIQRFQAIVTRPNQRDELTLKAGSAMELDRAALDPALNQAVREICRVGLDRLEFVALDELAPDARPIVDARQWE